MSQRKYNLYQN